MPTTITPLPTPPSRQDPANFANRGDAFLGALPTFTTETNALAAELNALALATGPGLFLNGTVTNPSISFANDTNTGFYLSTTDTIGFAAGGVERAKIDSSGLTLSGGTANGVGYLNASKVLTTGSALTFDGSTLSTTTIDATNVEVTNIKAKDGTAAASIADATGVISVSSAPVMSALTASQAVFTTSGKALVSNAITGTGNVVMSASPTLTGTIGAAAATLSSTLTLSGLTASTALALDSSKNVVSVTNSGTGNNVLATSPSIATPTLTGDVQMSTGNLVVGTSGKGIDFSAAAHASGMTSELLNDYEEGTWTPTPATGLTIVNGTGGVTFAGTYTKVGRLVLLQATITCTGTATVASSGGIQIALQGLPFSMNQGAMNAVVDGHNNIRGNSYVHAGTNIFLPSWPATNDVFYVTAVGFA